MTQGTLFTCARAEGYSGCSVAGLVITARCDAAQEKTPLFNYLPVVSFRDWLARDGRQLLCDRAQKELGGLLANYLKQAGFSSSVLETQSLSEIGPTLFPASATDKKIVAGRKQFEELASKHATVIAVRDGKSDTAGIQKVAELFPSLRRNLMKELVAQRIAGHYFIESVEPEAKPSGYVVLMREIRHLPKRLADAVAAGATSEEIQGIDTDPYERAGCLDFSREEFAYPIGELSSPRIEHLMQNFSMLFARIGIPDPEARLHDSLWDSIVGSKGGS